MGFMHEMTRGAIDFEKWVWRCLPILPLVCIAVLGYWTTVHDLNYPQHFNDACARFGEFYPSTSTSVLLSNSLYWLVPAVPLLFLMHKRHVVVVYMVVCSLASLMVYTMATEDLASNVNCYRRIGTGSTMIALVVVLQAFLLMMLSLVVFIRAFVRRFSWPSRRPARSSAP